MASTASTNVENTADTVAVVSEEKSTSNTVADNAKIQCDKPPCEVPNAGRLIGYPDLSEYKVTIEMFGNKPPMFFLKHNGKKMLNKRGHETWRKKEVDEWVLKAYEARHQYTGLTIEVQREVAAFHLDSFACNPRIVREMDIKLTGMTESQRRQIAEYENFFSGAATVEPFKPRLPSGDYTVDSGAEAFDLIAPYFPKGLEFDGIDYGYHGEKIFCYYDENTKVSVVVASDEANQRVEYLDIMANGNNKLMAVTIAKPKKVAKLVSPKVTEKSGSGRKKVADKKTTQSKNDSQAARWLEDAKVDDTGRFYIVPELSYKNFEANASWNPCFYIVTNGLKLRRVGLKFAVELAKIGHAIEISKAEVSALGK